MTNNERLLQEGAMNFCYADESGTGQEPIATMVGILVDAGRMHKTKDDWAFLLAVLSDMVGRNVPELHTADFYAGNNIWRGVTAETRVSVVGSVLQWLAERKHHIIYTSVEKDKFYNAVRSGEIPVEIDTPYRFIAFHLVLATQKYSQPEPKNKGNTVLVFDNEERERVKLSQLVQNPPLWCDCYYGCNRDKQVVLNQIIDAPYFNDSRDVHLLQVADFLAFFLRRYAEIEGSLVGPKYDGEGERITKWIKEMNARCIGNSHIYPRKGRNDAQELFYRYAPECIREL